jgi:hypothetical protein
MPKRQTSPANQGFTISNEALRVALVELKEACEFGKDTPYVISSVCTAVANMIAASGPFGAAAQTNFMRLVEEVGFTPEFYGAGIRVSYFAQDGKHATFGKGKKKSAAAAEA